MEKNKPPLTPEEEKAKEERAKKERRNEIILTAIIHTLLLPVLLVIAILMLIYLGIVTGWEKIQEWKENGWKFRNRDAEEEEWPPRRKLISHTEIVCRNELPVLFDKYYVVYVETEYNEPLNSFIRNNIEYIRKEFSEKYYHFVYIPELKNISDEDLAYAFPLDAALMTDEMRDGIRGITTEQFTRMFAPLIGMDLTGGKAGLLSLGFYNGDFGCGLYDDVNYSKSTFFYIDLQTCCPDKIKEAFEEYFRFYCGEKHAPFSVRPRDEYPLDNWQENELHGNQSDASDYSFYYDQKKMQDIAEEIRERVEILKQGGYIELLLHTLGEDLVKQINDSRKTATPLMHITVSDDLRIFIPELDNREVKMPSLARALYVFYLRHKEGVEFKFLSEFTEEIFSLYRLASNRLDDARLRATVDSLVNPIDNKINECTSRIKSAFLRVMDEYAARNYYLQMRNREFRREDSKDKNLLRLYRDYAKYISLPRSLVSYSEAVMRVPVVKGSNTQERCLREEEFWRRNHRMRDAVSDVEKFNKKKYLSRKKRETEKQRLRQKVVEASMAVLEMEPKNFLAHFNLGDMYCNAVDYEKSIRENTLIIEHDAYTWNASYINRAQAYLYAGEYDKGLADIDSYFKSLRRWEEADKEAERIRKLLLAKKKPLL